MRENRGGSFDDDAGVQTTFADLDFPNRFAGLRLDGMNEAVTRALNQQTSAVDVRDDWRRVSRVVRATTGRAYPHRLAGLLVESHETVRAASVLAPLESDAADDDEIAVDNRRDRAASVRREQTEIFRKR